MTGAPPPGAPAPPGGWLPPAAPLERARVAYLGRGETDYYFESPGLAVFLTIITCGIFGFYVLYQLLRRMRDHNRRRLEFLDAATELAWEQATERGLAEELRPHFERIATQRLPLQQLTTEFREPAAWLAIAIGAAVLSSGWLGPVVWFFAFVLLDGDLVKHDRYEGAVEAELSTIYGRLGLHVPQPDPRRLKGGQNYAGRIVATIFSCGIYGLWWLHDEMVDGNRHFEWNWSWDDALAAAVQGLSSGPAIGKSGAS